METASVLSTIGSTAHVAFDAPPGVRAALNALGRTEDARFSASGRRLAIACYAAGQIAVADVDVARSAVGPVVSLIRLHQFASPSLEEPHGLDFVDEETLVVANRAGGIALFRLPAAGANGRVPIVEALGPVTSREAEGPGSVLFDGGAALVCNNWGNTITRHTLASDWTLGPGDVIARKWLDLPDGLALSRDGRWLAVSNHASHCVLVYRYPTNGGDDDPVAVLHGPLYPHGLRFSGDGRYLVVADGGRPHVHVFASRPDGWAGACYPEAIVAVMDTASFERGAYSQEEGGPKGLDIHFPTNVLAVTSEHLPLAFFDLEAALDEAEPADDRAVLLQAELDLLAETKAVKSTLAEHLANLRASLERDELLVREIERLRQESAHQVEELARLRGAETELRATYESSHSWRLTRPLRAVSGGLRHLRRSG